MSKIAKKRKRLNIISNVYAFLVYALLYSGGSYDGFLF